ncbi:MAG: methyl-accepting chemotaxis protein [Oligoflexus sp.]|nr:methyl-accepting chemotaxis protein [Oligoflexus sp.]
MPHINNGHILNRLSVAQKLAILPFVFVIGISATLILMITQLQNQKQDAVVVHLGNSVRVLQERYLNEVFLDASGLLAESRETLRTMVKTTTLLRDGGNLGSFSGLNDLDVIPAAVTTSLQNKLSDCLKQIDAYARLGEIYLAMPKSDPERSKALMSLKEASKMLDMQLLETIQEFTILSEGKISSFISRQIAACVILIFVSGAIAWLITRQVTTPLRHLVRVADGIANGDLRQEKLASSSTAELGKLSNVFNTMLDNVRDLASQNISVAKNLSAASAEVLASVQQQAAATKQQAASVQETTTTMEEIGQSGVQIADRARQVSATAADAAQAGSTGLEAVQNTNRNMIAIREQVEAVAEKIVMLSERTQAIGEIIATVTDIAEQSNLLALNAAIEAAAAGEHGRSFSVVANEIKNLADQAKESTVRVRSILGDIQSGINSSVMLTEEAVKRVESGKQLAEIAENTILQMANTSKDSTFAFQQIVGATSQQQIGFEQITLALRAITNGAEQNAASNSLLERAAMSLNVMGQQLQSTAERYQI